MAFRFIPHIRFGNVTFGKRGASIRTGIPGLAYRHDYQLGAANNSGSRPSTLIDYGVGALIWNVAKFSFLCIIGMLPWVFIFKWIALLTAALATYGYIYPLLTKTHTYGTKREAVYVSDRRYKNGRRYEGTREIIDMDNRIDIPARQITLLRIEAVIKSIILIAVLTLVFVVARH